MFSIVLDYWHISLAAIALACTLRSTSAEVRSAAVFYFLAMATFYSVDAFAIYKIGIPLAEQMDEFYYAFCFLFELVIAVKMSKIDGRLARLLKITATAAAFIQFTVFAAYHVSWLKWTYGIYQPPLMIIEAGQCLAIIVFSGPVLLWSARRSRAEPRSRGGTWLAKTTLKHS